MSLATVAVLGSFLVFPIVMLLSIRQLHHTYAGAESPVQALRGVDLEIERGSFTALMGPSGCGKSTLLHLCGAMERPTSGEILFQETALQSAGDDELTKLRREKVGFIFQTFNLLPTLTALENAALPLRLAGVGFAESQKRASALLDRVGLGERRGSFPSQLSGGERQRAAIARALVHNPLLIIADEPTGSLDTANGVRVVELLREVNQEMGVTILLATHDPGVAAIASRQLRMRDGKLETEVLLT